MKILISGGHLTPALAFVDYVQASQSNNELVFVGREYSQKKLKQKAVEEQEIKKRNLSFIPFSAIRFDGNLFVKFKKFFLLIISVKRACKVLDQIKPDIFLSFGGYLAVPIAIAAYLKKIPILTHEQTRTIGMANAIIAKLATVLAVSFGETVKSFADKKGIYRKKVYLTGNPIRAEIVKKQKQSPSWMKNKKLDKPLVLITGGNQGSKVINQVVKENLADLLSNYSLLHICGRPTLANNYLKELKTTAAQLNSELQSRYFVKEWLGEKDLAWIYQNARLAISRSGANTVLELAISNLPSILIPLPFAYKDEQKLNAQWLSDQKAALLLEQKYLDRDSLLQAIANLEDKYQELKENLKKIRPKLDASEKIFNILKEIEKNRS
ncbi:MAG: UDP-N-acetylglucosamine--N-acetylmuramyl-(pentapeptide) pyrophosphoryl-undecaprenol N-acetylglucosamine transferase [Candidatus Woesebacteria bacterium]|jgi:UDP-N-acetylglucosamine--N-acetylmuramyl-(pentapeptide) pyrophosphoryl-undecaprenol N-acetylglucosamine transferase